MREIDISGHDGNAFAIMGKARSFAKQLGWKPSEIDAMIADMMSSDYDHLCAVFNEKFDRIAKLVDGRDEEDWDQDEDADEATF